MAGKSRVVESARLVLSVALCQLAGFIGSFFTAPNIPIWYAGLRKPFFTPPSWIFAPAWITLYAMMGVAVFLVWRERGSKEHVNRGLAVFGFQLLLNTLWSVMFFGLRSPLAGLATIILLWFTILWTVHVFKRISSASSLLLLPYLMWVSYAALLNLAIAILN